MKKKAVWLVAAAVLACIAFTVLANQIDITSHSPYDSYTRQALAWREGKNYLENGEDLPYLELAIFEEKYYVSFPPVPSVAEYVSTLFFGADTPNLIPLYAYLLLSAVALTALFARRHTAGVAVCYGLLCSLGTNLLSTAVFGGVWHEAQGLAFFFCSLAALLIDGKHKWEWYLSLLFAALAVGCRPFTAIFIPLLLWELYQKLASQACTPVGLAAKYASFLVLPALVAAGLMWYNYARFGNPFEFGHNYLPEFMREENGQFSAAYFYGNLLQCLTLPQLHGDWTSICGVDFLVPTGVEFNMYSANAFYLVNPVILIAMIYLLANLLNRPKPQDVYLTFALLVFVAGTCMHKTLGGCQFGARYFFDMVPYLALYLSRQKLRAGIPEWSLCLFGIALNLWGAQQVAALF